MSGQPFTEYDRAISDLLNTMLDRGLEPSIVVNYVAVDLYRRSNPAGAPLSMVQRDVGRVYRKFVRDDRRGWRWSATRVRVPII